MKRLVTIVEGYGEVRAVPVLTYRWLHQRGLVGEFFVPDLAINTKGCGNLKAPHDPRTHRGIEHYVRRALRARPAAILAILDADDECIRRPPERKLGPELLARARTVAGAVPVGVVVANREVGPSIDLLNGGASGVAFVRQVGPRVGAAHRRSPVRRLSSRP